MQLPLYLLQKMPPKRAARPPPRTYHASQYHEDDHDLDDIRWRPGAYTKARRKFKGTLERSTAFSTRNRLAILHYIITRPDVMEALSYVDGELHMKQIALKEQEDRAKGKDRIRWASLRAQAKENDHYRKMIAKVEKALMKYMPARKLATLFDEWTGGEREHLIVNRLLTYLDTIQERENKSERAYPFGPVTHEMARNPNLVDSLAMARNEPYVRALYRGKDGEGAEYHHPSELVYRSPWVRHWEHPMAAATPRGGYPPRGIEDAAALAEEQAREADLARLTDAQRAQWIHAGRRHELDDLDPWNDFRPFAMRPDMLMDDIDEDEDAAVIVPMPVAAPVPVPVVAEDVRPTLVVDGSAASESDVTNDSRGGGSVGSPDLPRSQSVTATAPAQRSFLYPQSVPIDPADTLAMFPFDEGSFVNDYGW